MINNWLSIQNYGIIIMISVYMGWYDTEIIALELREIFKIKVFTNGQYIIII